MIRRVLVVLSLVAFACPRTVSASGAKRHATAGVLAVPDESDVLAFPQLSVRYPDRAIMEVDAGSRGFMGGVLLGDRLGVGVFGGTMAPRNWYDPTDDHGSLARTLQFFQGLAPPAGMEPGRPGPLVALVLGSSRGFGVGLSVADALLSRTVESPAPDDPDGEPVDVEEGSQASRFSLSGGWSRRTSSRILDLAVHITINHYKTVVQGKIRGESSLVPSAMVIGRMRLEPGSSLGWLAVWQLYARSYDLSMPYHSNELSRSRKGALAGFGPVLQAGGGVRLWATVWLGYETHWWSLDRHVEDATGLAGVSGPLPDEASITSILLPGLDLAVEVTPAKWLTMWGGWTTRYHMVYTESVGEGPFPLAEELAAMDLPSLGGGLGARGSATSGAWAFGLAARFDGLRLEASVAPELLLDGPDMIGGRSPGAFAWLGMTFQWRKPQARPRRRQRPPRPAQPAYPRTVTPPAPTTTPLALPPGF